MPDSSRGLSDVFIEELKHGRLVCIREYVVKDRTLDLEIRNDLVTLYYRGCSLIDIGRTTKDQFHFRFYQNYGTAKTLTKGQPDDVDKWLEGIPTMKHMVDVYLSKHENYEKEFQQLIIRENNYSPLSGSTDYFIVDFEYFQHYRRFNIVGLQWESNVAIKKLHEGYKPKLAVMELIYGDIALRASIMLKHLMGFQDFLGTSGFRVFKEDMIAVFQQKRDLGLISGLDRCKEIKAIDDQIDYVFLITGHDPANQTLLYILKQIQEKIMNGLLRVTPSFGVSNFAGYSLYKENILSLDDFILLLSNKYKT
jgi:hypothetical protein